MERIKFYSEYDLENETNIKHIIDNINLYQCNDTPELNNINRILEYFNILKYFDVESFKNTIETKTEEQVSVVIKTLKEKIGKFIGVHKSDGFLNFYKEVDIEFKKDFWDLVDKYSIYRYINKSDFKHFLNNSDLHYSVILEFRKTVDYFDEILRELILQDDIGAEHSKIYL